jgi:ABC-2 type transport system permease protein
MRTAGAVGRRSGGGLKESMRRLCTETWIYFMVGLKQQASLAAVNALFSMVIPLGIVLMVCLMPVVVTKEVAILYISGNFVTSISNLCITTLAQILIGMRARNGFEHMATLPIYRASPLLGVFFSAAVSVLPALIVTPIVGTLLLDTGFVLSFWLGLIILMSMVIMIGLGAIIGTCSERYHTSQTLSMIMMFFVMFATPVYYSLDSLPPALQVFQRLLPFTYALEAMRSLMVSPVLTPTVLLDFGALFVFLCVTIGFTMKFFTWKQRK